MIYLLGYDFLKQGSVHILILNALNILSLSIYVIVVHHTGLNMYIFMHICRYSSSDKNTHIYAKYKTYKHFKKVKFYGETVSQWLCCRKIW